MTLKTLGSILILAPCVIFFMIPATAESAVIQPTVDEV